MPSVRFLSVLADRFIRDIDRRCLNGVEIWRVIQSLGGVTWLDAGRFFPLTKGLFSSFYRHWNQVCNYQSCYNTSHHGRLIDHVWVLRQGSPQLGRMLRLALSHKGLCPAGASR